MSQGFILKRLEHSLPHKSHAITSPLSLSSPFLPCVPPAAASRGFPWSPSSHHHFILLLSRPTTNSSAHLLALSRTHSHAAAVCRQLPAAGQPCLLCTTTLTTLLFTPFSCSPNYAISSSLIDFLLSLIDIVIKFIDFCIIFIESFLEQEFNS